MAGTRFSIDKLHAAGGEIYAHVFENIGAGVPRSVYWAVSLSFKPVHIAGVKQVCAMTCEWVPWHIRDWRELNGKHLDVPYGDEGVECSFYLAEHHPGERVRFWLSERASFKFHLRMEMVVRVDGLAGSDGGLASVISADAEVPFTGVVVVPENLDPAPANTSEVKKLCAPFLDLTCFQEPERREHVYVLRPRG